MRPISSRTNKRKARACRILSDDGGSPVGAAPRPYRVTNQSHPSHEFRAAVLGP